MEALVLDGMSEDNTREIVSRYSREHNFIRLVDNPKKAVVFAWNIGIRRAKGELIFLMGAHATYEKEYVAKCAQYLQGHGADNVGGVLKILSASHALIAKSIAFALSHPFGSGRNLYKTTHPKKPTWVDTVFGGCYRREVFEKIGLFNEHLARSQDMEFNMRLRRQGGKILLAPEIVVYYYAQKDLTSFAKHAGSDGMWATYPMKFMKSRFPIRHYIPLAFVGIVASLGVASIIFPPLLAALGLILFLYMFLSVAFSVQVALREKHVRYVFVMPLVFFIRHVGYGAGSLWGLIKVFL